MQKITILALFYLLDFTSQQTIIGSFKNPNDDLITIKTNKWSEVHLGIVYQYENNNGESPFDIQLHYKGTCISQSRPYLELHSSMYCPPEVLNQVNSQNIACQQLVLLIQGNDNTNTSTIGLNRNCVFLHPELTKDLPIENELTLQIQVIDDNTASTVLLIDEHSAIVTTSIMTSPIKSHSEFINLTPTSTLQPSPTTTSEASVSVDSTIISKSSPIMATTQQIVSTNTLSTTSDEQRWVTTERTGTVWNLVNNLIQTILLLLVYPIIIWRVTKYLKPQPQTSGNTPNQNVIKNNAFTSSEERRRESIELEIADTQED